jgi:phosphoglucomutase
MPTSRALDAVAHARGLAVHEVPTGWKYFSTLLDAGAITLCGEESFGMGCGKIREKDGLFACLAWLSVLAVDILPTPELARRAENPASVPASSSRAPGSVGAVLDAHWREFGRHYFARHDFEQADPSDAEQVFARLRGIVAECEAGAGLLGHMFEPTATAAGAGSDAEQLQQQTQTPRRIRAPARFELEAADSFSYTDPIDSSSARDQGLRFTFRDDSRIVFRKSGTGSSGVTVRVYLERFTEARAYRDAADGADGANRANGAAATDDDAARMLAPIIDIAEQLSGIVATLGEPTVRT